MTLDRCSALLVLTVVACAPANVPTKVTPEPAVEAETSHAPAVASPVSATAPPAQCFDPFANDVRDDETAACANSACVYELAKSRFRSKHYAKAAPAFRRVALAEPRTETSAYAALLYLECANRLLTGGPQKMADAAAAARPSCIDEMNETLPELLAHVCKTSEDERSEPCNVLTRIEADLARSRAEHLVVRADKGEANASALYRQGGDAYMAFFDERCAFVRHKKKTEAPRRWTADLHCDEMAYNAMKAYAAGGVTDRALAARAALLNPDNRLESTALAKRAAATQIP